MSQETTSATARRLPKWLMTSIAALTGTEEVFDFAVRTSDEEVSWVLDVAYNVKDDSGVLTVDDRGRPFVTTSVANAKAYSFGLSEELDGAILADPGPDDVELDEIDIGKLTRYPKLDGSKLHEDDHPVC